VDCVSAVLQAVGIVWLICLAPDIISEAEGDGSMGTSEPSEFVQGGLRAHLLISIGTAYFAFNGALGVRTLMTEKIRAFLNWKIFEVSGENDAPVIWSTILG